MAKSRGPRSHSGKRKTSVRSRRTGRSSLLGRRRSGRLGLLLAVIVAIALGGYAGSQDFWQDGQWPGAAGPDATADGAGRGGDADVDVDRAREQLAELTVGEWSAMDGYSRERFPHWRTVDGCDVRQTVLARDGTDIRTEEDSCRVESGSWFSEFDRVTLDDPGELDVDHIVPLANAWRTGADEWDDERRAEFANDLDTPQLIAVSATSNRTKGDQDPSQWRPEPEYWCQYAHDWVYVKHTWDLRVTEAEHTALADMLDGCDE